MVLSVTSRGGLGLASTVAGLGEIWAVLGPRIFREFLSNVS
jgi:hypothetical protein